MSRRRPSRLVGLLLPLLAALLIVPFLGTTAQADPDPADPAGPGGSSATPQEVAEEALETVEEILDPATAPAPGELTEHGHGKDLTLALRDLAATKADLPKSQRATANRLLARPDGQGSPCSQDAACYSVPQATPKCGDRTCVHYVTSGADAATAGYADTVLNRLERVANRYALAGYRTPVSDGATGGDVDKVDIYLAQIGDLGIYGYCTTDSNVAGHVGVPAYCVLDNNYAEFGSFNTPIENLEVTAAHEYFHAVQFGYDVNEDGWIMEATATWVEDELFDSINDNRQYLEYGVAGRPDSSLDRWSDLSQYGNWIFFRFLSERYPTEQASLPVIVRQIWEKLAHTGTGARSMYSVQAISSALADRSTNLTTQFASFTAWNRSPASYYSEGSAYAPAPLRASYRVAAGGSGTKVAFELDHLSAKHFRFTPTMSGSWNLRVRLNLNSSAAGGVALVTVKRKGQAPVVRRFPLRTDGNGLAVYPFGGKVDWIEVVAISASARYTQCGTRPIDSAFAFTCGGRPVDENVDQGIIARAVKP